MALKYNVLMRNAQMNAITTFAAGSALLQIYDGTPPGTGVAITTQNKLVQNTMNATFAAAAASGVLTLNAISNASAIFTATATWFRIVKSDTTTHVMDGTVSTQAAGTGDLQLNDTSIVSGGTVAISSATITCGNA